MLLPEGMMILSTLLPHLVYYFIVIVCMFQFQKNSKIVPLNLPQFRRPRPSTDATRRVFDWKWADSKKENGTPASLATASKKSTVQKRNSILTAIHGATVAKRKEYSWGATKFSDAFLKAISLETKEDTWIPKGNQEKLFNNLDFHS